MRIRIILTAIATAIALGGSLQLASPASASTRPYVYGVYPSSAVHSWHNPSIRPPYVNFGTDSSLEYRSMSWWHWNNTSAYGRGTRWSNTCNPTCAAGNYAKHPGSITLWRVRWHNGHRYYTRMTLRWTTRHGTVHHKVIYSYRTHGGTVLFWG
jgi:hypothetical protein